ncbi:MAG: hypothetical protein OEY56_05485, partial [Cyclobacteriaceae bacterium]|nr:hypothetical protein [Cyclobacteriaceae bacterium]
IENRLSGSKRYKSKFYVGSSVYVQNNWLVNPKTLTYANPDELNRNRLLFTTGISLHAGKPIRPRLDLVAEYFHQQSEGQDYQEYIEGTYQKTGIRLSYTAAEITAKTLRYYQIKHEWLFSRNLFIGAFGEKLTDAYLYNQATTTDLRPSINTYNFGLVTGGEISFQPGNRISYHTGVRFRYGLTNIYAKNPETAYSLLSPSSTLSGRVYFSVQYHIGK